MTVKRTKRQGAMQHIVGKAGIGALPTGMGLAAFTAAPGADGTGGTEVSTAGGTLYARLPFPGTEWDTPTAADPTVMDNANVTDFAQAGASWGTVLGLGLMDAQVEGVDDFIIYFPLSASVAIDTNDTLRIPAGNMSWSW